MLTFIICLSFVWVRVSGVAIFDIHFHLYPYLKINIMNKNL